MPAKRCAWIPRTNTPIESRRRLTSLNRFDEAKAVVEKAIAQGLNVGTTRFALYQIAFFNGDDSAMQRQVERLKGKPEEPIVLLIKGKGECALGKGRVPDRFCAVREVPHRVTI